MFAENVNAVYVHKINILFIVFISVV